MKCNRCGTENNEENKFCTNCGNELLSENNPQEIICDECGEKNKPENNYCIYCGERLKTTASSIAAQLNQKEEYTDRVKKKKKNSKASTAHNKNFQQKKIELRPFLITVVVIIVSFITIVLIDSWKNKNTSPVKNREIKSTNPAVEAIVYEIASKFVCSCGSCGEESLEKCTCPRAVEERQFIRDYVEKNSQQKDIVVALANRYGYLKAKYASDYNVDASRIWKSDSINAFSNSKSIIK